MTPKRSLRFKTNLAYLETMLNNVDFRKETVFSKTNECAPMFLVSVRGGLLTYQEMRNASKFENKLV